MKILSLVFVLLCSATQAFAGGERSYGSFEVLGKQWLLVSLSNTDTVSGTVRDGDRLELKVVEDEISQRRFQSLWMDALTASGANVDLHNYIVDLDRLFNALKGPLLKNDHLALERQGDTTILTINHYEHAVLSGDFFAMVVTSLTDRIAPIPVLKQGLTNELPADQRRELSLTFMGDEVSLRRVNQTARWIRFDQGTSISQL